MNFSAQDGGIWGEFIHKPKFSLLVLVSPVFLFFAKKQKQANNPPPQKQTYYKVKDKLSGDLNTSDGKLSIFL